MLLIIINNLHSIFCPFVPRLHIISLQLKNAPGTGSRVLRKGSLVFVVAITTRRGSTGNGTQGDLVLHVTLWI